MFAGSTIRKALASALTVAVAVEATGVVTGVADHYLTMGITAACAAAAALGITYTIPNADKATVAQQSATSTDEQTAFQAVWDKGIADTAASSTGQ